MSAPVKGYCIEDKKLREYAETIISDVKNALKKADGNVREVEVFSTSVGHGFRPFGNHVDGDYIDYRMKVCGKEYNGLGKYDIINLFKYLLSAVQNLSTEKGFASVKSVTDEVDFSENWYHPNYCKVIRSIRMLGKPCKEFVALNKYLVKYGCDEMKQDQYYYVDLFGKRGQYDESGTRAYLCFRDKVCERMLAELRKKKSSRDTIKCESKTIDDIDTEYSIRYETECYGQRVVMPQIIVSTPSGKQKGVVSWY